ncbi:hypothetical protein GCM10009836_50360 [Pseudonocardia ailaonensis]|uniref:STAS domain-containing protein n=1 Tax=Pseudonocardia ailaonensis TaxID=367279 RepID=A0ABN2NE21_9PSEU
MTHVHEPAPRPAPPSRPSPPSSLEIEIGSRTTIRLAGELDPADIADTRKLLAAYVRAGTTIAVDLTAVAVIGPHGVAALAELADLAHRQGSVLEVIATDAPMRQALTDAGLTIEPGSPPDP